MARRGGRRSLYLIDVRTPEEYAAGHLRGARSAPGGQLVQETDAHVATWGGRIVLVDDDGVRATMTASWLKQMGWAEVAVLVADPADGDWETGPHVPRVLGLDGAGSPASKQPRCTTHSRCRHPLVIDLDFSRRISRAIFPAPGSRSARASPSARETSRQATRLC